MEIQQHVQIYQENSAISFSQFLLLLPLVMITLGHGLHCGDFGDVFDSATMTLIRAGDKSLNPVLTTTIK